VADIDRIVAGRWRRVHDRAGSIGVKAVQRGATTLAEVQAACGAATRCGGCEPAVRELLQRAGAPADTHVHIRPAFGLSA
jgi:bacterioferritin-associated ferredoxin